MDPLTPPPPPARIEELIAGITPEVYERLKQAVALGRWENGDRLTPVQVEHSLQLLIAYEARHVPLEERLGYLDPSRKPACKS